MSVVEISQNVSVVEVSVNQSTVDISNTLSVVEVSGSQSSIDIVDSVNIVEVSQPQSFVDIISTVNIVEINDTRGIQGIQGEAGIGVTPEDVINLSNLSGVNTGDQDLSGYLLSADAATTYQPLDTVLTNTTASFTTAQETKLAGIEAGAQVNTVDSVNGQTGAITISKSDVGLGNADNTADADKPVSTATQTALDGKANSGDVFSGIYDDLTGKPVIPTDNAELINGAGYITDYTVTEGDVTAHEAALSITESQISDLQPYITASSTDTLTNKSGSNSQWANDENYVVEDNVLISSLSSGMISGGAISVNAGDNTKFDISAGVGVIVDNWTDPDNPVKYEVAVDATGVDVTNITTQNQTHVLLMPDGSIDQREQPPSASARRNCIYLGQIGHGGRTVIQGVLPRPDVFASPVSQLRDLMYALGAINLGVTVSAGGGLTISRNAGQIFLDGANAIANPLDPHLVSLATESPKLLVRRTQTGQGTNSTDMDVGNYDVGGVVTPITGNKYQNMRAYQFGNGNLLMQYGQATYNSLANAVEAIQTENFIPNSGTAVAAVLVGIISVRSTATDLSDPAQAQFSGVSMFGDTSVTGSSGGGVAGLGDSFETVSKNLKVSDSVLSYSGDVLNSIVYATSGGGSITKTLNYTGNLLTSITLSGDTPTGIDLTKTLSYTGGNLTGVTYS